MAEPTTELTHIAADPGVLGTLGINAPLFFAQLINVAIVLAVLHFLVFKPLTKTLEDRRKKIEGGIKNAEEAEKRLASAKETEENMIANARAAAHKTMEDARAAGEQERRDLVARATEDIDAQVTDAKKKIDTERRQAHDAVRREMAGLVLEATKKVAGSDIDSAMHQREIERAIAELEAAPQNA